jgi:hypothetical protein
MKIQFTYYSFTVVKIQLALFCTFYPQKATR